MRVIIWIAEGTWRACLDAAHSVPSDAQIVLLHMAGDDVPGAASGAFASLLGRGHPERDPGRRVEEMATSSAEELLREAAQLLGRPSTRLIRRGRIEREVVSVTESADLLILARDGDRGRLGPRSLGPASRFVVDHAACSVLLVWPEPPPGAASIPSPPPHPPHHQ